MQTQTVDGGMKLQESERKENRQGRRNVLYIKYIYLHAMTC